MCNNSYVGGVHIGYVGYDDGTLLGLDVGTTGVSVGCDVGGNFVGFIVGVLIGALLLG